MFSVEENIAGTEFGVTLNPCPYFDEDVANIKHVRPRRVVGLIENKGSGYKQF